MMRALFSPSLSLFLSLVEEGGRGSAAEVAQLFFQPQLDGLTGVLCGVVGGRELELEQELIFLPLLSFALMQRLILMRERES
ncbi:hypothetical protein V8C44DRAFT_343410, partial [Trichoderma aethiopicum]